MNDSASLWQSRFRWDEDDRLLCLRCGAFLSPDGDAIHDEWHDQLAALAQQVAALDRGQHQHIGPDGWERADQEHHEGVGHDRVDELLRGARHARERGDWEADHSLTDSAAYLVLGAIAELHPFDHTQWARLRLAAQQILYVYNSRGAVTP